jgi:hypothetical protein
VAFKAIEQCQRRERQIDRYSRLPDRNPVLFDHVPKEGDLFALQSTSPNG